MSEGPSGSMPGFTAGSIVTCDCTRPVKADDDGTAYCTRCEREIAPSASPRTGQTPRE